MPDKKERLLASKALLTNALIEIVRTRLELISSDIEKDRARLFTFVMLYMASLFCMTVGIAIAITLSASQFWTKSELNTLYTIAGVFIFIGFVVFGFAINKARNKPILFSGSLLALEKDIKQSDYDCCS